MRYRGNNICSDERTIERTRPMDSPKTSRLADNVGWRRPTRNRKHDFFGFFKVKGLQLIGEVDKFIGF